MNVELNDTTRDQQLAHMVRREFLKGAGWLAGAVVIGVNGAILTACSDVPDSIDGFSGDALWRDQPGYETARRAAVWVQNMPQRYPRMIVTPRNEDDVCAAVKFAAAQGMKVAPKSGGHSWAATYLQQDTMLLDLGAWNQVLAVDASNKTATLQPSAKSGVVAAALKPYNLTFPTGHNADVTLGGFLLCGGFGRNGRHWDVGCRNIVEIECVNARGELIRANETENADFYWAARGAGPGFFGVLTKLKVRVFDLPKVIHQRIYVYDMADFDAVMRWSMQVMPQLPSFVETMVFRRRLDETSGDWGPDNLLIVAVGMADSDEQVEAALQPLETCPARQRAKNVIVNNKATLEQFFARNEAADPKGLRFSVDGFWSDANPDELVPALREMYDTLPTPRSFVYYAMWGPVKPDWPDMAMSIQAPVYIAAHALWDNEADDARMHEWTSGNMRKLERFSLGSKLNDDATIRRPSKYFSDAAQAKLAALTRQHDPNGVFRSFLKVGDPT